MAKRSSKKSDDSKKTARGRSASARPALPTKLTRRIHRPDDIALSAARLFPKEKKAWKRAASNAGYLRIRPTVMLGMVGLCGSLDLGNPPEPHDVDAWEASKPKDHWDYWALLDFVSVPASGPKGGLDVILFHNQNSFEQRPLEIVDRIHLPRTPAEMTYSEQELAGDKPLSEEQTLVREWGRLCEALAAKYGTADLKRQKWTVQKKVYDITFPDQ